MKSRFFPLDPSQIDCTIDPLVKLKLLKRQRKHNSIIIHYKYERRFAHYKSRIHQLWNGTFPPMNAIDTKLIVGTRNNPNLTKELVRRSPYARTKQEKRQTRSSWPKPIIFLLPIPFSFTAFQLHSHPASFTCYISQTLPNVVYCEPFSCLSFAKIKKETTTTDMMFTSLWFGSWHARLTTVKRISIVLNIWLSFLTSVLVNSE